MKDFITLRINREGEFSVEDNQQTPNQCGKVRQQTYKYFCTIEATDRSLTKEGYVMENLWTDEYFQERYVGNGIPVPSCEKMATYAVEHFRHLFKIHPDLKKVDLQRIYVRIHGSPVSFIEAEWVKNKK